MKTYDETDMRFKKLLEDQEKIRNNFLAPKLYPSHLRANANATLDDFIRMIAEVVSKSLKEFKAEFRPDEGAVISDPEKKLEHPVILYSVKERIPKLERKNRPFETVQEPGKDGRKGTIWTQRQSCIVQFDVVASEYSTANQVMSNFEDMIITYAGYFKSQGVAELLFKKYYTDQNLDKYRQWLSVRSIQYYVEIEKLTTVFDTMTEDFVI